MGHKLELACGTQFPTCLLCNRLSVSVYGLSVSVPRLSCLDVTDHMAKDWETSRLDGKCPSQVSYVYDRPVCFQVRSLSVHGLSGGGVLELYHDSLGSFSRQYVTV